MASLLFYCEIQIFKGWMWVVIPDKPFTSISTLGYISKRGDPFLCNSTKCWSIHFWGYCSSPENFTVWVDAECKIPAEWKISSKSLFFNTTFWKKWSNYQIHYSNQGKKNHSTHFTSYKYVFKWNLIVRATRSTQHAFFPYLSRGQNNNNTTRKPFPWQRTCLHKSPLAIIFCSFRDTSRGQQNKDMQGKPAGSSAGYCMDCLNGTEETHILSYQQEVVIDWDILLPKETPTRGVRKRHLSCNSPHVLKSLKFPIWLQKATL